MLEFDHIDQCKIKFDIDENDPQYQQIDTKDKTRCIGMTIMTWKIVLYG